MTAQTHTATSTTGQHDVSMLRAREEYTQLLNAAATTLKAGRSLSSQERTALVTAFLRAKSDSENALLDFFTSGMHGLRARHAVGEFVQDGESIALQLAFTDHVFAYVQTDIAY